MHDDQFLAALNELVSTLDEKDEPSYWKSPLPSPTDDEVGKLCKLYVEATPIQQDVMVACLSQEMLGLLGSFEIRMAMVSVRENSRSRLLAGLIAVVMELECAQTDVREILMTLSVMYNSAAKLGNPDEAFEAAAEYAINQSTRDVILGFLMRTPELKRIEAMGWQELEGPNGLVYRFGGQPIPDGFM